MRRSCGCCDGGWGECVPLGVMPALAGLFERCKRLPSRCCTHQEVAGVHAEDYLTEIDGLDRMVAQVRCPAVLCYAAPHKRPPLHPSCRMVPRRRGVPFTSNQTPTPTPTLCVRPSLRAAAPWPLPRRWHAATHNVALHWCGHRGTMPRPMRLWDSACTIRWRSPHGLAYTHGAYAVCWW